MRPFQHGNADIAQATAAVSAMKTTSWADDVSDDEDGAPAPVAKPAAAPQPAAAKPAAAPQPAAVEPAVEASEPAGPPVDASEVLQTLVHTLSEVEVKLAEQQADSKSPLFSAHTFEELELCAFFPSFSLLTMHRSPELLKGVYSMGFNRPSKIQERALLLLLRNGPNGRPRNVIAQSQSGTGKTAAFVITCLSRVDASLDTPQALILAPARELAVQTNEVLKGVGKFTTVKSCLAVAGRRRTHFPPLFHVRVLHANFFMQTRALSRSRLLLARPVVFSSSCSAASLTCRRSRCLCSTRPTR